MPGERQLRGLSYEAIWKGQMKAKKEEKKSTFGRGRPKEKKRKLQECQMLKGKMAASSIQRLNNH